MTARRGTSSPPPVDWEGIRRRLDAIGRGISETSEPHPERVRQTLEARARTLAEPPRAEPEGDRFDAVLFQLGGETYALEAGLVWEVFPLAALSPLPGAEPPVFGVTVWRGTLLTLLDLREVLGLTAAGLTDLSRVILLGVQRPAFGMLADLVAGLVSLRWKDVGKPPEGVAVRGEYLRGVTGSAILLLAGEELLRRHWRPAHGVGSGSTGGLS